MQLSAGAAYVSPFLGRLDDISQPGIDLIQNHRRYFCKLSGIETEIIAASVRNPIHVTDCALAGADIATVPYDVIEQMTKHPLTDQRNCKSSRQIIKQYLVNNNSTEEDNYEQIRINENGQRGSQRDRDSSTQRKVRTSGRIVIGGRYFYISVILKR